MTRPHQYREDVTVSEARAAATELAAAAARPARTWPERFRLLALAAEAIGDQELAAYWRRRIETSTADRASTTSDYSLPPGMPRARALQIAGPGTHTDVELFVAVAMHLERMVRNAYAPITPGLRTDALDEGATVLERNLARGMVRAAGGREDELRVDAAQAEARRKLDDEWNNAWKRPPRSVSILGTHKGAASPTRAARVDGVEASPIQWGEEWRRPPRSDVYIADAMNEPARRGGLATVELPTAAREDEDAELAELAARFDDRDTDQPVVQRATASDLARSENALPAES